MPVTINGTTGISSPDGSAGTPTYRGTSGATNGVYFPSATTAALATNGTQALYIDASQNVGIGTSSPSYKLDVNAATSRLALATTNYAFSIWNNTGGNLYCGLESSTGGNLAVGSSAYAGVLSVTGAYSLQFGTNNNIRATIDSSGNLLVGTTSSDGRLTVVSSGATASTNSIHCKTSAGNTTLRIRDDGLYYTGLQTNSPYNFTSATSANAVVFSDGTFGRSTSSLRYKTNVKDAIHGLSDVLNLRPVTYNGINDGDKVFGGLIAEEVEAAGLKEFVAYDNDGKPDALHYGPMVSLAFKAIQELSTQVDALKAEVATLKVA